VDLSVLTASYTGEETHNAQCTLHLRGGYVKKNGHRKIISINTKLVGISKFYPVTNSRQTPPTDPLLHITALEGH